MQSHLLSCLLLSLTLSWSNAMPVPSESADGPHDVRWRMVAGMETAFHYAIRLQEQYCATEPLLNVSDELGDILSGVCRLMGIHELTTIVQNGSDLHAVLGQNILDSCNWLNHLVTSGEVIASPRFLNLSDSCELGDMPRLSHYCQEERFRTLRNSPRNNPLLSDTIRDRINRPLSNYYSGTVVNTNMLDWLNAAITSSHQRESIETTLLETYSCTS